MLKDKRSEFLAVVGAAAHSTGSMIFDLDEAAHNVYWLLPYNPKTKVELAIVAAAKTALEEATRGQAFRFDTAKGPIFDWDALYEFSGRCGSLAGPRRDPWFAPPMAGVRRARRPAWTLERETTKAA